MKRLSTVYAAISVALLFPAGVQAQSFPAKPVHIVVPYPPGGATDAVARLLGPRLSDVWRQPVVIDNRPGAGTTIGAEAVAKASHDGYTLLFTDAATFVLNPFLYSSLSYDPIKDFAPITIVCRLSWVLAVATNAPGQSVKELIAHAKANPGKLSYASPGNGTSTHVAMEHFKKLAGIDVLHVPYKGAGPAMVDLLAGRVSMFMVNYSVFEQYEKAGKLKVLAAATPKRLALRPDLPTIAESGVPGFAVSVWFGMAAPSAVPPAILDKIREDVVNILQTSEFQQKALAPHALEPVGNSRAEFAAVMKTEAAHWGSLVKASGARLD